MFIEKKMAGWQEKKLFVCLRFVFSLPIVDFGQPLFYNEPCEGSKSPFGKQTGSLECSECVLRFCVLGCWD
jgi:hypothetical protein